MKNSAPAIFLPGMLCDERVWFPCWKQMHLQNRGYVPLQWAESLEQMLALTGDRITEFGAPAHLIGFSMGGYVATQYTLANPQHVKSLTLVGYNAEGLPPAEEASRHALVRAIENNKANANSPQVLKQYIHPSRQQDEALTDYVSQMSEDLGAGVLRGHILATTPRPALVSPLAKLRVHIHIVAAEDDHVAPVDKLKNMHTQFKHSRLSVVEQAAHMMLLEKPQQCARIIQDYVFEQDQ